MKTEETFRILGKDVTISNNTWKTQSNNNDVIIGSSSAGKTRYYVLPNLNSTEESFIVCDTKGDLYRQTKDSLISRGFKVDLIDFVHPSNSTIGYCPLDHIRRTASGKLLAQDVKSLAKSIIAGQGGTEEPFWDDAAELYLSGTIAYVLELLLPKEQNLSMVNKLVYMMGNEKYFNMFKEASELMPDSLIANVYNSMQASKNAEKMYSSIIGMCQTAMGKTVNEEQECLFTREDRIQFESLGEEKRALFVTVSDHDSSTDRLLNVLYTQAIQHLIDLADSENDRRLKIPTRIYLDDYGATCGIPDFDRKISTIRSREISVSIILQSVTQLESMYDVAKAETILQNCDTLLFLGGHGVRTLDYISRKVNKTTATLSELKYDQAILFHRGSPARIIKKCIPDSQSISDPEESETLTESNEPNF